MSYRLPPWPRPDVAARDLRPSPEALLAGGRTASTPRPAEDLSLGAAPGVGKTYEMLHDRPAAARREGVDVVVGVVETHGRKGDGGAARGPGGRSAPAAVTYQGHTLTRDGSRRHPGARRARCAGRRAGPHATRPAAGIPSATSMSRSCSAPASTSTRPSTSSTSRASTTWSPRSPRVRVRETVPDPHRRSRRRGRGHRPHAQTISMQRLREGKVYVAGAGRAGARRTTSRPATSRALRRAGAARARRSGSTSRCVELHAGASPSPARGRRASACLVCVSEQPERDPAWCATASALADRLHGPVDAPPYVETRAISASAKPSAIVAGTAASPSGCGADTLTIPGQSHRRRRIGLRPRRTTPPMIIIGKSTRSRWSEMLHGSVVHELLRQAGDISVHVIAAATRPRPAPARSRSSAEPAVQAFDPLRLRRQLRHWSQRRSRYCR